MKLAPLPPDEPGRLAALRETHLLGSGPEREFDDYTRLVASICQVPGALISLVDADRQWFKSRFGLELAQTARDGSFASWAITGREVLEVPDAAADERFAGQLDASGTQQVGFFAGAPLVTAEGHAIGVLLAFDTRPRLLDARQREALEALARQLVGRVALRTQQLRLAEANVATQATRRRLEHLLDDTSDLIHTALADGRLVYTNRAWRETLGHSEEEVLSLSWADVVAPEHHAELQAVLAGAPGDELAVDQSVDYVTRTGERRRLVGKVRRRLVHGAVQVDAVLSDVTERRRLDAAVRVREEELRALSGLQRAILDGANLGIVAFDADGRVVLFSAGAERMLAVPATGLLGRRLPWAIFKRSELADRMRALARELGVSVTDPFEAVVARARRGLPDEREWTLLRHDGSEFPALVSVTPLKDAAGGVLGFLTVGRDMSELKAVERLKSEFVSTVSHELRTPLTSIRGALGLVEGGVVGELPPEMLEVVQIARSNCDRLIRLVNDILDLDRMEAGKLELRHARVEASELLRQTLESLEAFAAAAQVKLEGRAPGDLVFMGDRDRLTQVLTNLVSNAVKYSPPGGTVRVRVGRAGPGRLRWSIVDQGPGIPQDLQGRLFRRFHQLDQSDARAKGGSGLGLAISRAIVEQHGGRVGVESAPGQGATFWFEVPSNAPTPLSLPRLEESGPHLLVVEDDPDFATALMLKLREGGYRTTYASTIAAAEASALVNRPDALLLDLQLPDGSGLEVATRFARHPVLCDVPVLVISGTPQTEHAARSLPRLVRWLEKPVDGARLANALRLALRKPGVATVLVVEDDPGTRSVIAAQVRGLGVRCVEAEDGARAVALARAEAPDLIVLDVNLPGPDGFTVVEELRAGRARTTPLIVYTGRDLGPHERAALTLGLTRHLTKSRATDEEFLSAVRELLLGLVDRPDGSA